MSDTSIGAMTIRQFTKWAGICRTTTYELIGRNELKSFKVGARRLIRMTDASEWLDRVASAHQASGN